MNLIINIRYWDLNNQSLIIPPITNPIPATIKDIEANKYSFQVAIPINIVFMKLKDRINDFRGLKALWSAPILLQGLVLQHNFIESHTTTRKIPCELAGQHLTTKENRWLELIRLS